MSPNQAQRLGDYLRRLREKQGLSQAALGRSVGVPNSTIVRLEKGEIRSPRPDLLGRIADSLGVTLADIYAYAGYATPDQLPTLVPYLRSKYSDLPDDVAESIAVYAQRLAKRHGVDLRGPAPGEDEAPEPPRGASTRSKRGRAR